MVALDEVWRRAGGGRIHMLKIDTEGAEVSILDGASDDVLRAVDNAAIEYHHNLVPGAFARYRAVLDAEGIIYATRRK